MLNSTSLQESNDASQDSLQQAINTVSNVAASYQERNHRHSKNLGRCKWLLKSCLVKGAVTDKDAGALAEKIASATKTRV